MKYWEIIADNVSKAGWSWGWVSALDLEGQTTWVVDARFDPAKCHHHQESKSGSFVRRKFVEPRLGFYEQRREIGVGSPHLHSGTHQSADGQERGRFQRRCVLSELNCKVDQRDADQHCSDDLTDRSNRFPVHLRTPIGRLTSHKLSHGSCRRKQVYGSLNSPPCSWG